MIDLEQRLGYARSRYLTNNLANLPCPPGLVAKDLVLAEKYRQRLRLWFDDLRAGTVIGGTGRGLLVKGPASLRNVTAGALATTAVVVAPVFRTLVPGAIPVRCISATAYLDAVRNSYDDGADAESGDLVRACKSSFIGRAADTHNVRLLVLTDLGAEPRRDASDFPREELRALLSLRVERGMPTIITSRLGSGDLPDHYKIDFAEVITASFTGVEVTKEAPRV